MQILHGHSPATQGPRTRLRPAEPAHHRASLRRSNVCHVFEADMEIVGLGTKTIRIMMFVVYHHVCDVQCLWFMMYDLAVFVVFVVFVANDVWAYDLYDLSRTQLLEAT